MLFVGDIRPSKGLDLLTAAAELTGVAVRRVGGRGHRVSDAELRAAYDDCDLVVCPYRDEYERFGSASAVVAEALAYAAPLVVTPALRGAVPGGYRGVVFAEAATVEALATVLGSVDVDALQRGAQADAPGCAADASAAVYAGQLLSLGSSRAAVG